MIFVLPISFANNVREFRRKKLKHKKIKTDNVKINQLGSFHNCLSFAILKNRKMYETKLDIRKQENKQMK